MREQPAIPVEHLEACLREQYALVPTALEFLPLGLDYQAGVYRVECEQGLVYLLKVTSRPLYEPGCLVPYHLNAQGISSVIAPLPTRSGKLWAWLEGWNLLVYPFIEGDTSWTGMTDEQWKEVGATFQQIHQTRLPSRGFEALRQETFDPAEYARWLQIIETQHIAVPAGESPSRRALRASWLTHQATISATITILEMLGEILRKRTLPYVICHADLHPANLLRDRHGHVFVIDWDEVMLAPKERDFIFVQISAADSKTLPGTPAFFQGYGQVDIDWPALTYYRYERVIQDMLASAQEVFLRDDLGEGTKADSAQLFQSILAGDGEIDAAFQASAHLLSDLTIPTRMIAQIERELTRREKARE